MDSFRELRRYMDGQDPYIAGGHQILKIRRIRKRIPDWVNNPAKVQAILLRSFPKLTTDAKQRLRAGRWTRVINLYFRRGWTSRQIAEEMSTTQYSVESIIRSLRRVISGLRADGSGVFKKSKNMPKFKQPM